MKKFTLLLSLTGLLFAACSDYDDSAVWNELNDHASRLAALEKWQETANGNITALQGLITALQQNDYVTGVTAFESPSPGGSRITFTKSSEVTIWNGMQGEAGIDGTAPAIAVEQYPADSGVYYWTIDLQDGKGPQWMEDADGNKLPVTGRDGKDGTDGKDGQNGKDRTDGKDGQDGKDGNNGTDGKDGQDGKDGSDGITPQIRINSQTNSWEISTDNGQTWTDTGIPATGDNGDKGDKGDKGDQGEKGDTGDSIFAADGVDHSHPDYVVFTLANGQQITVPKVQSLIAFQSYETFYGSATNNELTLILPAGLQESDFITLSATIAGSGGTSSDIRTRAAHDTGKWNVRLTEPTFTSGTLDPGSAKVTVIPPDYNKLSETALLTVTLTDKNGKDHSVSRAVKYFDGTIVENTAGQLNGTVDLSVKTLAVTGSINLDDFYHIVLDLTQIEVLDLSMTDLVRLPDYALNLGNPQRTLRRVYLPSTLREIGVYAFNQCFNLEYVDTENVETIEQWAFRYCLNLREVKLNDGLKTIDNSAFYGCNSLTAIEIPGSVEILGRWLFEDCDRLETVILNEGIQALSPSTFYGCGIASITLPTSITEIPNYTFENCENLERVNLHDGITAIGEAAFVRCRSLRQIQIPKGVTRIEKSTFMHCISLRFVDFHDEISHIGESAFFYCTYLTGNEINGNLLTLPAGLLTLETNAFSCTDLVTVTIPSLETIPDWAFSGCERLVGVTFPDNLRSIGQRAFEGTAIEQPHFPASLEYIDPYAFSLCKNLTVVVSQAVVPPTISSTTFDSNYIAQRQLRYPRGSDYSSWSPFFNTIQEMDF